MDHATRSAYANVTEAATAPLRPDSHAVQDFSSPGPGENLPSGINSPDRGVPNVQSSAETAPADSSSAVYHAAPLTNDASEAETVPDEEQGPVTAEEDVQPQPGVFATEVAYFSFMQMHLESNATPHHSDSPEHFWDAAMYDTHSFVVGPVAEVHIRLMFNISGMLQRLQNSQRQQLHNRRQHVPQCATGGTCQIITLSLTTSATSACHLCMQACCQRQL